MMSAKILRHKHESQQGWLYRASEQGFETVIRWYGKTLNVVLRHQFTTLMVAVATLVATVYLFVIVPKGFFPVQDTGRDPGHLRSAAIGQLRLDGPLAAGIDQGHPARPCGREPVVVHRHRRHEHHAQQRPHPDQSQAAGRTPHHAIEIIRRLQKQLEAVDGITLFMQPVQDLTVETRVSRTQYQYSLEDPDAKELAEWAPKLVTELQKLPQLRDVASDQQNQGLQLRVVIDRDTASRLGITPQMIDDVLYDAFGQRQVSIMFTQLNQYRVVLEVKPEFRRTPQDIREIYIHSPLAGKVPLSTFTRIEETMTPLVGEAPGAVSGGQVSFNLAPGVALGDAVTAIDRVKAEIGLPPSIQANFQGTAKAFQASLDNEAAVDPGGTGHGLHRAGRAL